MKFLFSFIVILTSLNGFSAISSHSGKLAVSSLQKKVSNQHHHSLKNTNKQVATLNGNVIVSTETDDLEDQDNDNCSEKSFIKISIDKNTLAKSAYYKFSKLVNSPIQFKRLFILLMVIRI